TPSWSAKADCVRPSGTKNSSRSISPGWVGGRCVGRRRCTSGDVSVGLVVVRDFDLVGIAFLPPETDPVLFVDADAVLSGAVTPQPLQVIARGNAQLRQLPHAIDLV